MSKGESAFVQVHISLFISKSASGLNLLEQDQLGEQ